jgi:hypothetical protein
VAASSTCAPLISLAGRLADDPLQRREQRLADDLLVICAVETALGLNLHSNHTPNIDLLVLLLLQTVLRFATTAGPGPPVETVVFGVDLGLMVWAWSYGLSKGRMMWVRVAWFK